jgi:hypothetical protein
MTEIRVLQEILKDPLGATLVFVLRLVADGAFSLLACRLVNA